MCPFLGSFKNRQSNKSGPYITISKFPKNNNGNYDCLHEQSQHLSPCCFKWKGTFYNELNYVIEYYVQVPEF